MKEGLDPAQPVDTLLLILKTTGTDLKEGYVLKLNFNKDRKIPAGT